MAIRYDNGNVLPINGDWEPVGVYEGKEGGFNTIFEPSEETKDGTQLEFEETYNDEVELTAWGKSEQVTTTGKNLIGISDFTSTDAAAERGAENGRIYIKGITSLSTSYILTNAHGSNLISSIPQGQFLVFSTYDSGFSNERLVTSQGREIAKNTSFVLGVDETIVAVMCDSISIAANEVTSCYIQIEKAASATSYEPYTGGKPSPSPEYPQEIKSIEGVEVVSRGRNLLDYRRAFRELTQYGVTAVRNDDGSIHIFGTNTRDGVANFYLLPASTVPFKAGTYTVSCAGTVPSGVSLIFGGSGSKIPFTDVGASGRSYVVSASEDTTNGYTLIQVKARATVDTVLYPMVEHGTVAHPYEPYHSTTCTIDLQGHQLRSLPDGTKDELRVHRDGRVELVKQIDSVMFDGSCNYATDSGTSEYFYVSRHEYTNRIKSRSSLLSSKFKNEHFNDSPFLIRRELGYIASTLVICFSCNRQQFPDGESFRQFMAQNPAIVYFQLATPQTIQLPSIDPIPTYHPYTFIDANGVDLSANVRIID